MLALFSIHPAVSLTGLCTTDLFIDVIVQLLYTRSLLKALDYEYPLETPHRVIALTHNRIDRRFVDGESMCSQR